VNSIRTIIIDDEKLARELVKSYLQHFPELQLEGECTNGFEGIKMINELKPDLVFLDIQMPKITGFEMLELIEEPPAIIFTTAYDEFALKAFEVNAVDYLLKPFSEERFSTAVNKALKMIRDKEVNKKTLNKITDTLSSSPEYLKRIVVKNGSRISVIPAEEIQWIEAQDDYIMIHTKNEKHLKQKTMSSVEKNLDPSAFVRVHRSYIISLKELKKIVLMEKESYRVILNDNTSLPVSKSGYNRLKETLR
jgi:two-component system, LytTR family, response regulator